MDNWFEFENKLRKIARTADDSGTFDLTVKIRIETNQFDGFIFKGKTRMEIERNFNKKLNGLMYDTITCLRMIPVDYKIVSNTIPHHILSKITRLDSCKIDSDALSFSSSEPSGVCLGKCSEIAKRLGMEKYQNFRLYDLQEDKKHVIYYSQASGFSIDGKQFLGGQETLFRTLFYLGEYDEREGKNENLVYITPLAPQSIRQLIAPLTIEEEGVVD